MADHRDAKPQALRYDYENQAWIRDGRYQDCAHPTSMTCGCYGRAHKGEPAGSAGLY